MKVKERDVKNERGKEWEEKKENRIIALAFSVCLLFCNQSSLYTLSREPNRKQNDRHEKQTDRQN